MRDGCRTKAKSEHEDSVRWKQSKALFRAARRSGLKWLTPASEAGILGVEVMHEQG